MPVPSSVQTLAREFDAEYTKKGPKSGELCSKLKVELAKIGNQLLLTTGQGSDPDVLKLSRDVYEKAAFLCIQDKDVEGFERHVKQLKCYYRDFDKKIGVASSNEYKILGLYLLSLLATDRISEFHGELELIPNQNVDFIQRPVMLERSLTEGNYTKINQQIGVLSAQEHYPIFLDMLLDTMRRRIMESLERSTKTISVDQVQKMLYLKSAEQVRTFVSKLEAETQMSAVDSEPKYKLVGKRYHFAGDPPLAQVSGFETVSNIIDYATEIERIV